jgi:hypothetical protein
MPSLWPSRGRLPEDWTQSRQSKYVCMYVCVCVCMCVCACVCMYVCARACLHVCMYACMHVEHASVRVGMCMRVYTCQCMYMCMYSMCLCVCIFVCKSVCVNVSRPIYSWEQFRSCRNVMPPRFLPSHFESLYWREWTILKHQLHKV